MIVVWFKGCGLERPLVCLGWMSSVVCSRELDCGDDKVGVGMIEVRVSSVRSIDVVVECYYAE